MWQTRADRRVDVLDDKVDRQFDVKILGGCGAAKKGRAPKISPVSGLTLLAHARERTLAATHRAQHQQHIARHARART